MDEEDEAPLDELELMDEIDDEDRDFVNPQEPRYDNPSDDLML